MSLINKMLQDLDARNASEAERVGLAPHLRALPPKKTYPWKAPVFAALGAVAGGLAVWLLLQPEAAPVPAVAAPAAPPPPPAVVAPAPAPAAVALPAMDVPLPAEPEAKTAAPPKAAKPTPSIGKGLGINPSLKVDLGLSLPGTPAEPAAPTAAAKPAPMATTSFGGGRIEKQAHTGGTSEAADGEYRKAMAEVRRGATGEGIAGLRRTLQIDPRFAQARQALLSLLVETQQWAEAQTACAEGLAVDPGQSGWAMLQARLQVEKGDTALAAATLAQYAAGGERNADYQAFHALLLNRLQRPKEAAQRYRAALALRPAEGRWWYGLGLSLEADQRPQEAHDAFMKAREAGNLPSELATAVEQKLH